MRDDPEKPDKPTIPEAGPEPEPDFDAPANDAPHVVDAPARSDEF